MNTEPLPQNAGRRYPLRNVSVNDEEKGGLTNVSATSPLQVSFDMATRLHFQGHKSAVTAGAADVTGDVPGDVPGGTQCG